MSDLNTELIIGGDSLPFTYCERALIEICLRNRIDEIDETENRGLNPDGTNEIRNTYLSVLDKLGVPNVEYRK